MFYYITSGILWVYLILKFYKHSNLFKKLSAKEWLHSIVGFLFAWATASLIILGGGMILKSIQVGSLKTILFIVIILIGLSIAGIILEKCSPKKLEEFYK